MWAEPDPAWRHPEPCRPRNQRITEGRWCLEPLTPLGCCQPQEGHCCQPQLGDEGPWTARLSQELTTNPRITGDQSQQESTAGNASAEDPHRLWKCRWWRESPGQPLPCFGQDQEEQKHACPSDCLLPVQSDTSAAAHQNSLSCASGVRLKPAGHRWNRQHWGLHQEQGRSQGRDNRGMGRGRWPEGKSFGTEQGRGL